MSMSVARAIEWQKIRAPAEALLARIDVEARHSREQRAKIARARAERALKVSDAELRERFRRASADAKEWPGLRSEFDKASGRAEILGAPIKLQVEQESTPAARGQKTTIAHPERVYATQYWLHRHGEGHGAMLPGFHEKFGKFPVLARTLDGGRLHVLDGHHRIFYFLREGGRALSCFVFDVATAVFQDGAPRSWTRP